MGALKSHVKMTTATTNIINPLYSTTIWVMLVDKSVDKLVLSIKVSGTAILLKP